MAATHINAANVAERMANARQALDRQEEDLQAIAKLIEGMQQVWDSPAQRLYAQSFQASRKEIGVFNQSVQTYLQEMNAMAESCAALDEKLRSLLARI